MISFAARNGFSLLEDHPHTFSFLYNMVRTPLISLENDIINLKSRWLVWLCLVASGRKLIELQLDTFLVSVSAQSSTPVTKPKKDVK
jgi:hypothetical protein